MRIATGWPAPATGGRNRQRESAAEAASSKTPRGSASTTTMSRTRPRSFTVNCSRTQPSVPSARASIGYSGWDRETRVNSRNGTSDGPLPAGSVTGGVVDGVVAAAAGRNARRAVRGCQRTGRRNLRRIAATTAGVAAARRQRLGTRQPAAACTAARGAGADGRRATHRRELASQQGGEAFDRTLSGRLVTWHGAFEPRLHREGQRVGRVDAEHSADETPGLVAATGDRFGMRALKDQPDSPDQGRRWLRGAAVPRAGHRDKGRARCRRQAPRVGPPRAQRRRAAAAPPAVRPRPADERGRSMRRRRPGLAPRLRWIRYATAAATSASMTASGTEPEATVHARRQLGHARQQDLHDPGVLASLGMRGDRVAQEHAGAIGRQRLVHEAIHQPVADQASQQRFVRLAAGRHDDEIGELLRDPVNEARGIARRPCRDRSPGRRIGPRRDARWLRRSCASATPDVPRRWRYGRSRRSARRQSAGRRPPRPSSRGAPDGR